MIGIGLPNVATDENGYAVVPDRFLQNYRSGYAVWKSWKDLDANPALMVSWIEDAVARDNLNIVNPRDIKGRNG